jgi:hypothetical protein
MVRTDADFFADPREMFQSFSRALYQKQVRVQ